MLDKVAGEPISVSVGDKTYKIARVRISDLAQVAARIRDVRIAALLRHQRDTSQEVVSRAFALVACNDPKDEDIWGYLATAEGTRFLLWLLLSRHQPGITDAEVETVAASGEIIQLIMAESGLGRSEPLEDDADAQPDPTDGAEECPVFNSPPAPPQTGGESQSA